MAPSGHTNAQLTQPVHSLLMLCAKWYPFLFRFSDIAITLSLHAGMQIWQPLHLSMFTTISPFTFAMILIQFIKLDLSILKLRRNHSLHFIVPFVSFGKQLTQLHKINFAVFLWPVIECPETCFGFCHHV